MSHEGKHACGRYISIFTVLKPHPPFRYKCTSYCRFHKSSVTIIRHRYSKIRCFSPPVIGQGLCLFFPLPHPLSLSLSNPPYLWVLLSCSVSLSLSPSLSFSPSPITPFSMSISVYHSFSPSPSLPFILSPSSSLSLHLSVSHLPLLLPIAPPLSLPLGILAADASVYSLRTVTKSLSPSLLHHKGNVEDSLMVSGNHT